MEIPLTEEMKIDSEIVRRWYCVRSKPKHEHIASGQLRMLPDVEVFCPLIRYQKVTVRGPVWFTEAVFPGYVFARLNLAEELRKVSTTLGVDGIVHFRQRYAELEDSLVDAMRNHLDGKEIKCFSVPIAVGEHAQVIDGPFVGLDVVVTRFVSARERVRILLNVLGRVVEADVKLSALAAKPVNPLAA